MQTTVVTATPRGRLKRARPDLIARRERAVRAVSSPYITDALAVCAVADPFLVIEMLLEQPLDAGDHARVEAVRAGIVALGVCTHPDAVTLRDVARRHVGDLPTFAWMVGRPPPYALAGHLTRRAAEKLLRDVP
jgi:hypothetical protein